MRDRKPWYRKSKNAWFVELNGKQVRLAVGKENKQEAQDAFHKLMVDSGQVKIDGSLTVEELKAIFLNWSKVHHEPDTVEWYSRFQSDFCSFENIGKLKV